MSSPITVSRSLPPMGPAEETAYAIVQRLRDAGHESYTVGGAVRDRLLARYPDEVDVATSATPEQVQALFSQTVAVGAAFGVIVVVQNGLHTEVATFRTDADYIDGRRPTSVSFSSPAEDAQRRDFTVNALFYDPVEALIIDHVGGLRDLERGVIQAIGEADRRFREDHLRMMRAVRFATRFDFALAEQTAEAIRATAAAITRISPERLFAELTKIITGPRPHQALALLDEVGLLAPVLPELTAMHGVEQPAQFHPEGDVWVHNLLLQELMVHPDPVLAWGCLLHDVGKPPTFEINDKGREAFPCHANVGAEMTREILTRLRCSNQFIEQVVALVYNHMTFKDVQEMRKSSLRRLMGRETFRQELELHRIDCLASNGMLGNWHFLLDKLHERRNEPVRPTPLLSGRDVLALGVAEGPMIGRLLREAEELQLSDELTDRESALVWLRDRLADEG